MTPRDRLQRLVDLGRKTLRYWWLVARVRGRGRRSVARVRAASGRSSSSPTRCSATASGSRRTVAHQPRGSKSQRNIGEQLPRAGCSRACSSRRSSRIRSSTRSRDEKDHRARRSTSCAQAIKFRRAAATRSASSTPTPIRDRAKARHGEADEAAAGEGRGAAQRTSAQATVEFAMQQKEDADEPARKNETGARRVPREASRVRAGRRTAATGAEGAADPRDHDQGDRRRRTRASTHSSASASASRRASTRRPTHRRFAFPRRRRPRRSPPKPRSAKRAAELAAANRELEDALSQVHRASTRR